MILRVHELDFRLMVRTVWGEARGESYEGMVAVAHVILNRAKTPGKTWWGDTIADVCLKPLQFSCWNPKDPNRSQLHSVTYESPAFLLATGACALVLAGRIPDPTGGATHYMRHDIVDKVRWDDQMVQCARIGAHVFFREAR